MKCLVCYHQIRINRLQELLALERPLLCARCQAQLNRRSTEILYERNFWFDSVLERLNQGDICLNQIFFQSLKNAILKHQNKINKIVIVESKKPYPWLEILVSEIQETLPKKEFKGDETLIITEFYFDSEMLTIAII